MACNKYIINVEKIVLSVITNIIFSKVKIYMQNIQLTFLFIFCLCSCEPPDKNRNAIDSSEPYPNTYNIGCPGDVHNNTTAAGGEVYVTGGQEIIATFYNGSASYNSNLFLENPTQIFIGQQNNTPDGTQTSLGFFGKGQKLVFSLQVPESGHTWYSGEASSNIDGIIHARIIQVDSNLWFGGFEDLESGGDNDFDDVCFTIQGNVALENPNEMSE